MKLLIFIPCYNEATCIKEVVEEIPLEIKGVNQIDILVIDDGSSDDTLDVLSTLPKITVLSNGRNRGISYTFQRGIEYALQGDYDLVVNIDGDGQFDPKQIPDIVHPITSKRADFVTGSRFSRVNGEKSKRPQNMAISKYYGNIWGAWVLSKLYKARVSDVTCGFRAYSCDVLLALNIHSPLTYTQESIQIVLREGFAVEQVPITVVYKENRVSRVVKSVPSYIASSAVGILRTFRDHEPLKFFGILGAIVFLPGLAMDLFLLVHYFLSGKFSPYIFVGFAGAYFKMIGIIIWVVGFSADMQKESRMNQEKIIRLLKKEK